jgi:hypothetical protein
MKLHSPSYAMLAAASYGLFCALGIAVWYTLLFVALPKEASAWSTLQDLLLLGRGDHKVWLWLHATATVATGCLTTLLLLKPPVGVTQYLRMAVTSALFAAFALAVFSPDTAILPAIAAGSLAWGWFRLRRGERQ